MTDHRQGSWVENRWPGRPDHVHDFEYTVDASGEPTHLLCDICGRTWDIT